MTAEVMTRMGHKVWIAETTSTNYVYVQSADGMTIELGTIHHVGENKIAAYAPRTDAVRFISADTLRAVAELLDQHNKEN